MGSQPRLLSGSRAAAVLGLSEFTTRREVWQMIREELEPGWNARHGYTLPPPPDNAAIRWGSAFEDAVCELSQKVAGKLIVHREKESARDFAMLTGDKIKGPMTCHVDGIYDYGLTMPESVTLHEGKTTNSRSFREKWGEPGSDHIPASYQAQVQHQMLVTGAREVIVSVLVFPEAPDTWEKLGLTLEHWNHGNGFEWLIHGPLASTDSFGGKHYEWTAPAVDWARVLHQMGYFHPYPVAARPDLHASMLERYREFWDRFILGDEIPPAESTDDARRLFPEPVGTLVVDEQTSRWLAEFAAIRDELTDKGPLATRKKELQRCVLEWARTQDAVMDEESREKTLFMSADGKKLGQYSKSGFRVN